MDIRYVLRKADSPIIAVALHDGQAIDAALAAHLKLASHQLFREEDPYTGDIADLPVNSLVVHTSRFQVDLNRRKQAAIYKEPADAWGLDVWGDAVKDRYAGKLMEAYEAFYAMFRDLLESIINRHGCFVILDIHSYNHRRDDPNVEASADENPEINIGTIHNDPKWAGLTQKFISYLSHARIADCRVDVRENVKFKGGGFSEWVNEDYSDKGCVLSVEFKKTFMDEWTGRVDVAHLHDLKRMLEGSLPLLMSELESVQQNAEM